VALCFGNDLACNACATTYIFGSPVHLAAVSMSSLLVFIYGIGFIFWLIEALNLGARYYWEALLSLFRGDHQKFTGIAQENRNYVRSSRKKQFEESKGSEGSKRPEKEKSLWVDDYGQYIGEDATLGTVISGNKPKRQKLS
jgi:hypothetical protein